MSIILVVDDHSKHRQFLARLLGQRGHVLREAANGAEALSLLRAERINLVITDLFMPLMHGFELVRQIRRDPALAQTPVIFCTNTFHQPQAQALAPGCGILGVITKSAAPEDIFSAVDAALNLPAFPALPAVPEEVERVLTNQLSSYYQDRQVLEELVGLRTGQFNQLQATINALCEGAYYSCRATLQTLAATLEARDVETHGHSQRVVAYCLRLGQQLGLSDREMIALEHGALLHDIGKIGIPDAILLKPGPHTPEEREIMRSHVERGAEILKGIEFLQDALPVVRQHHEKWDGSGYPLGLKKDRISLNARIFAVADAVDAITSDRPYRAGSPFQVATAEVGRCAGTHFDPQIVAAFLAMPLDEWLQLRESKDAGGIVWEASQRRGVISLMLSHQNASWIERATGLITAEGQCPRPSDHLKQQSQFLAQH